MGKCAKRVFQNGGAISKADQLMAEMAAKYGTTGAAQAEPVQPPAQQPKPQAQPAPQPQGITSGIIGVLKGRQQQIDKASGYRNGGKIQGPGTSTSDSIPATVRETGEGIAVSTKERILSADQDALLEAMARKSGFDSLDAMLEAGTGKPVGPTIKGGKRAASNGISFLDDFSEAAKRDTPLAGIIKPFQEPQKLMPGVPEADRQAYARQSQPAASQTPPTLGTVPQGMARVTSEPSVTPTSPDTSFMTGAKPGEMPSSAQGGFTQGGKSYNVNPSSQEGIARVTAPGTSPLYTNIKPEDAVSGLKNQMIGGDAASVNEGLVRYANANKIRGDMIDSMVKANGGNGIAVMPEAQPVSQGMSISDIQAAMKSAGTRTERAAYGQMLNTALNNQVQTRGQDLNYSATMAGQGITARGQDMNNERAAAHDQVIMRGQDISGANDAIRAGIDRERLGIAQADSRRADDKWGIERGVLQGHAADSEMMRGARAELTAALASGDQKKIEAARSKAVAAGIKFDKPNNEYVTTTDSMGMNITRTNKDTGAVDVIEGKSGKIKASIPGPGIQPAAPATVPQGFMVVGTSGGRRVLQDAQGKRFVEGN